MKKLVLVMVCVLLMALFIAFNYLLWDRESKINELRNLENLNANNNALVNSRDKEIKSLEDEKNKLQNEITVLGDDKDQLIQKNSQLDNDKKQIEQKAAHKIEILNILKENVDIKIFQAPLQKWIDAVNAGKYDEAYKLEFPTTTLQEPSVTLEEYSEILKNTVKSIKLKEAKLDTELGVTEGEIFIAASLEVKTVENADLTNARFVDGLNNINYSLDYDNINKEFFITSITTVKK
jgi:hypothetical protein